MMNIIELHLCTMWALDEERLLGMFRICEVQICDTVHMELDTARFTVFFASRGIWCMICLANGY